MVLFHKNHSPHVRNKKHGFTLIELLITILIFGTLIVVVLLEFNPLEQIQKGRDAQREHDLKQIQAALDEYFNDTGCYPQSIPFGQQWKVNQTIYMTKVPQDTECTPTAGNCYRYEVDTTTSCPQWNILFAYLRSTLATVSPCSLTTIDACLPTNYSTAGVNYCVISGKLDCPYIAANAVPGGTYQFNSFVTPTPSTIPTGGGGGNCSPKNWSCTGGPPARCNVVPAGTGQYCNATCNGACL